MKKVAILGIENSHSWFFSEMLAGRDGSRRDDIELIGLYAADINSEDAAIALKEIGERSVCDYCAKSYDEFVGKVDAVMITARHGGLHLTFAKPYLELGLPVWIDKPICTSPEDAIELVTLAKKYNAPICGGSMLAFAQGIDDLAKVVATNKENLRGGHVTAPIKLNDPNGGFWFYGQHLVQMLTKVFGYDVRSVKATLGDGFVEAVYRYDNFNVTAYFGTGFSMTVYSDANDMQCCKFSLDGCVEAEMDEFCEMLETGKGVESYKNFIAPVFIIDATIKAYEQGCEVEIHVPEV